MLAATLLALPSLATTVGTTAHPPLLSRRAHALAGGGWLFNVTAVGSATIRVGNTSFDIVSAFSEPGTLTFCILSSGSP